MTEEEKKQVKISGVDSATKDTITSSYTPSDQVTNWDNITQGQVANMVNKANSASSNGIISNSTWDKINSSYQMSSNVQNAMNYTDKLLEQLSTGKTSYTDKVSQMVDTIMNREEFSYDPDTDTLFQNALASAMNSGKSAMQDTMGQAAALTGGYGSSYATSAANQAYNAYIEEAYDNLPEYYNMALQTYQMDTDNLYKQYSMLSSEDDKEYGRLETAYNANFQNWTQKYGMEYEQWRDSVSFALQSAGLQLDENNAIYNMLSSATSASQNYSDSTYARDYGQYQDSISNAMNLASMEQSDYWKRYSASKSGSSSSSESKKKMTKDQMNALKNVYELSGEEEYNKSLQWLVDNGYDTTQAEAMMGNVYDPSTGQYVKEYQSQRNEYEQLESENKKAQAEAAAKKQEEADKQYEKENSGTKRLDTDQKEELVKAVKKMDEQEIYDYIYYTYDPSEYNVEAIIGYLKSKGYSLSY